MEINSTVLTGVNYAGSAYTAALPSVTSAAENVASVAITGTKYAGSAVKAAVPVAQNIVSVARNASKEVAKKVLDTGKDMDKILILKTGAKCVVGAGLAIGVATVTLPVVGFTGAGVAAHSVAAFAQSCIGNVAAGSAFAMFQSAGVVGMAVGTKAVIGGIGALFATNL